MMKKLVAVALTSLICLGGMAQIQTNAGVQYLQNNAKDMSTDFYDLSNTYFLADSLVDFNTQNATGKVNWKRYRLSPSSISLMRGRSGCGCSLLP